MSKIGKQPVTVPKGVEIKIEGVFISIKGPKGSLKREINHLASVVLRDDVLITTLKDEKKSNKGSVAIWGLTRALINNMVKGVSDGFEKKLEFEGVGYKANVKGEELELNLGYSHPISIKIPAGLTVSVEKNVIKIVGVDNELIGHFAAEIKSKRLPEPYKGSGIRYKGEVIRRKAGKKAATAA